jgi:hypothetical protein
MRVERCPAARGAEPCRPVLPDPPAPPRRSGCPGRNHRTGRGPAVHACQSARSGRSRLHRPPAGRHVRQGLHRARPAAQRRRLPRTPADPKPISVSEAVVFDNVLLGLPDAARPRGEEVLSQVGLAERAREWPARFVSEVDVETAWGIVTSVITTRSVDEPALKPGSEVVALVKRPRCPLPGSDAAGSARHLAAQWRPAAPCFAACPGPMQSRACGAP